MSEIRSSVLGALLCLFVVTSGCAGVLAGDEPAVFEASPVAVSDGAASATDFEHQETRSEWINRSVEVAGQEREVRAKNHVTVYQLPPSVGADGSITFGLFTAVSTPQAAIAGQPMNPVGKMPPRQLVDRAASQSGQIEDVERVDARTVTILGVETEVVRFSGVVRRSGHEVPVYIEVTRFKHDGDFVIAAGAYPQGAGDVRTQVRTLFDGIEH